MSSSTNKSALLSNDLPSSKEQESQRSVTVNHDGDQSVKDADQAGSSTEAGALSLATLQASLPKELSKAKKLKIFKSKAALAEVDMKREEEEKRRDKSRQDNLSTFVGKPIPSAAPSLLPRKWTALFDGAKESSKCRREEPLPRCRSGSPAFAAPTNVSEIRIEESDFVARGNPLAPALLVPEGPILSVPTPFPWTDFRNPGKALPCIIQANYSSRVGSFAEDTKEWAFQITFHSGGGRFPTIDMNIFSDGKAGPRRGRTRWCLSDYIGPDWMVTDFKIHRVADCANDRRISHNKILAACKTDEEKTRLICISLEASPKISGNFNGYGRCKNPHLGVKELHSAVFKGQRPYHLFIWFLGPNDLETFEKQCLSYFTRYFEKRKLP